jgi:rhodanese-related sulfurtransferase
MMSGRSLLAMGLASLLVACGDGGEGGKPTPVINFEPLAQAISRQEDRVTADELARWLIEDKRDFILVDVRSADDFEKGHIEDARHLPIAQLVSNQSLQTLPKGRKIVLYSNGSEDAAKAEVMLRLAGYEAYLLLGGYNYWNQHILNPDIPPTAADGEAPEIAEQRAISCFFAGGRAAGAPSSEAMTVSQPLPFTPPVLPPSGETPGLEPPGLMIEEGC